MSYKEDRMSQYIVAHDLGTSGDKATLFQTDGKLVASITETYDVNFFGNQCAEQNPDDWWNAVCRSTKKILEKVPNPCEVIAVSFSAQMQGCLIVDKNGIPIRPAMIWADHRARKEQEKLQELIGEDEIYKITGHRLSASYSIEKLMWLKENEPENFGRTYKMLQAKDYIIYKLTGKFVTDYSDASGTNAFDLEKLEWSDKILHAAGISKDYLPKLCASTDVAGCVSQEAALITGLAETTLVVCGGGDGPCSAVGAGCVEDNELFATYGTSAWIGGTMDHKFIDDKKVLFCFAHVIPGKYMPCGTMQSAGSSYGYIKKVLMEEGKSYKEMDALVMQSPPGAKKLLFLPYLLGERSPRWNPDTTACFLGIRPEHNREDYLRAVLEGVAMNLELILQAYQNRMKIEELILTGGGAKGEVLCQILADICSKTLKIPGNVAEATSIGAAVTAGVGAGIYTGFSEVKRFIQFERTYLPNAEHSEIYQKMKYLFDQSYNQLEPLFIKFWE